ncbi:MAG: hypothetical protein ABSE72_04865 [Bacteroidales bacterium]
MKKLLMKLQNGCNEMKFGVSFMPNKATCRKKGGALVEMFGRG